MASDIQAGDWIERHAPRPLRPYLRLARLDRPIGTWLLLLPCWWSLVMALPAGGAPDLRLMLLFAVGAVVMRGAGCTVNDMADREIDARVARTATRPLASGALSLRQAAWFLVAQSAIGLVILLSLPPLAIGLGILSLLLVALYPFMKRVTWWPQAFLGLAFNWGALMGWAALRGALDWPALLLYTAGIAWTLFYDTIYAHQDKDDDALIGVRSTALLLGARTRPFLFLFALAMLAFLSAAIGAAGLGWIAWTGVAAVAAHLAWQAGSVDLDDPRDCLAKFKSNRDLGLILLAALLLERCLG